MSTPERTKAILLARFSPRPNADECESCEAQLADLTVAAGDREWLVAGMYRDDAVSGDDCERPGMWSALKALKPGYVLMVRNLNRLSRDTLLGLYVLELIDARGALLFSLEDGGLQDTGPQARFVQTILLATASLQKHETARRTSARMRQHQAEGRIMSKIPPYGKRVYVVADKPTLVDHPVEKLVIENEIIPRFELGMGCRTIARELEKENIRCRGREQWRHNLIHAILVRAGRVQPRRKKKNGFLSQMAPEHSP